MDFVACVDDRVISRLPNPDSSTLITMGSSFSSFNADSDLLNLKGKVAIVTGAKYVLNCSAFSFLRAVHASSGLGLYIALHLVRRGAKVYLAARTEEKAKTAIERLKTEGLGDTPGEIVWLKFDLSEPLRAKASALSFLEREERLDILGTSVLVLSSASMSTYSLSVNNAAKFAF